MVSKSTVLILGAGASIGYGFPSGYKLLQQICKNAGVTRYANARELVAAANLVSITPAELQSLADHLRQAPVMSIDAFLEIRPEFMNVGKFCIGYELIPCETEEILFAYDKRGASWYQRLFDAIRTPRFEQLRENHLSVLTFNYDRSLEHFLHNSVKIFYNRTDAETADVLSHIPIIHLHGDLGRYAVDGTDGRRYNSNRGEDDLRLAMKGIRVISEEVDLGADPAFSRAYELVGPAERIVLLGFGYHETNLARLRLSAKAQRQQIWGTCFGMSVVDRTKAHGVLPGIQFGCRGGFNGEPYGIMEFLDNYAVLS